MDPSASSPSRGPQVLTGTTPQLAHTTLHLSNGALHWADHHRTPLTPEAGSGIAASIVDTVLGPPHHTAPPSDARTRERAIPVDQTHTSVIVDERWVVKIVRNWGNADRAAHVLQRINQSAPAVTAAYGGCLTWQHPTHGTTTIALVTEYVPHTTDGWQWAPDDVARHVRDGTPSPAFPTQLGTLVAQVHLALVEADTPGTATDPRNHAAAHARTLATRVFADPPTTRPHSAWQPAELRLHHRRTRIEADLATLPTHSTTPLITPHGDLHLGQFLRTDTGRLVLLDFDGDPQWDTHRQHQHDGAARDIAHLLVSLMMVASVAQRRLGGPDQRATDWATRAQHELLTAYRAATPEAFLDETALPGLIAEQFLAETQYARDYLPPWRYASDGALTAYYPRPLPHTPTDPEDPPWNPPALPTTSPASPTP